MAVATHLEAVRMPSLLPGITLSTAPTDYIPSSKCGCSASMENAGWCSEIFSRSSWRGGIRNLTIHRRLSPDGLRHPG